MKKFMKPAIVVSIIVFAVIAGIIVVLGVNYQQRKEERRRKKAEDPIINAIQDGLGEKVSLYMYEGGADQTFGNYYYLFNTYEKDMIAQLETTLNNMQNKPQNEICVVIYDKFHGGAQPIFSLKNHSRQEEMTEDGKFTYLAVYYPDCLGSHTDFFLNPEIYTTLSDVRHLRIQDQMQKLAEEAGIDWYEVWPDLESVEVFKFGE